MQSYRSTSVYLYKVYVCEDVKTLHMLLTTTICLRLMSWIYIHVRQPYVYSNRIV